MAQVFDTGSKTPVRVKDPITDDTLPSMGSLNWKQITSGGAVAGTNGVDCMLVHGDRWQQMDGSLNENYIQDKKINVQGTHTETIMGNRSIKVVAGDIQRQVGGSVNDQIMQSHNEQVTMSYSLQSMKIDLQAGMLINILGALVKINS